MPLNEVFSLCFAILLCLQTRTSGPAGYRGIAKPSNLTEIPSLNVVHFGLVFPIFCNKLQIKMCLQAYNTKGIWIGRGK